MNRAPRPTDHADVFDVDRHPKSPMIPVRAYFNLLTKYLRPLRWRALALGVVLLVAITLQLLNPQIVAEIIDRVTTGTDVDDLVPLAVAFMVIAVAHQLLAVTATWLAECVGWSATNELRAEVTDTCSSWTWGSTRPTPLVS